jgi:hypothetical protein
MLLRTLFLVVFLGILAEVAVHGAAALARATLETHVRQGLRSALSSAVAAVESSIASSGGSTASIALPTPMATCFDTRSAVCAIAVTVVATIPSPVASASPATCPQTDCTVYLQGNSTVAESRFVVRLTATASAANGDVVASRSGDVAFRTFASAPYVSPAGSLDETLNTIADGGVGDDGGNESAAGSLVNVEYLPSGANGPAISGDVWRTLEEHPATNAPPWDR